MIRRTTALLLALMVLWSVPAALGQTHTDDIYNVVDFKFFNCPDGIGCGYCPVYTAPGENAYRVGNAGCDTSAKMALVGYVDGWLLVRYRTNGGGTRVGYIPPRYVSRIQDLVKSINRSVDYTARFSAIECVAAHDIAITDNPMDSSSSFGTIPSGSSYRILGKYTYNGNWWYVECELSGQTARGFIGRKDLTLVLSGGEIPGPYPTVSDLGGQIQGMITVTGDATMVRRSADPGTDMVGRANAGDTYPYYETKIGSTNTLWYHVWADGVWGWIAGGRCRVTGE